MVRLGWKDREHDLRASIRASLLGGPVAALCVFPAAPAAAHPIGVPSAAARDRLPLEIDIDRARGTFNSDAAERSLAGLSVAESAASGTAKANLGTFDVAAEPNGEAETRSGDSRLLASALVPPVPATTRVSRVEDLLVVDRDFLPATRARVEDGAIVLTSAATISSAALTALGAPTPLAASTGTLEYRGSTLGCFDSGCTPTATATVGGLTFTGGTFSQRPGADGFVGIGGGQNNFGTLSLDATSFSYTGISFTLLVNFASPTAASSTFSIMLLGGVNGPNTGGVQLSFGNSQSVLYGGGTFTLTINGVAISGSQSGVTLSGFIFGPAPAAARPQIPLDHIVTSISNFALGSKKSREDEEVLDLSNLALDDSTEIDTGVTSGSDASESDAITVDEDKVCTAAGSASAAADGTPAACGSRQQ